MSYVFQAEVKELVNGKVIASFVLPDSEMDCRHAAMAFLELMAQKIRANDREAVRMAECFFTVSENLKHLFPEIGEQLRHQMVAHIKKTKDEKKGGKGSAKGSAGQ